MSTVQSESRNARTRVKPRPAWLQALGASGPPERIEIEGVAHDRVDVFKHDSWAATALYGDPEGRLRVVKFHRRSSVFGVPMFWLGLFAAHHEALLLGRLGRLEGVPRLAGRVTQGGRRLRYAVARDFLAGHPLNKRERVDDQFFPDLSELLATMHRNRVLYIDLHKRENIIVTAAGRPALIDFQIGLVWPDWLPRWPLFELLRRSDVYHLQKHWSGCRPDQCGYETADLRRHIPWWIKLHRAVARPFRECRRRLLVRVGVRAGKGRVETEHFAEDALRSQ